MSSRIFKRHDTKGTPWARFLDEAGVPIDLTDATVVYTLQDLQLLTLKIDRQPAIVRDQLLYPGETFYSFVADDVDAEMYGSEEWEVLYPDTLKESFPVGEVVTVTIEADLDNV